MKNGYVSKTIYPPGLSFDSGLPGVSSLFPEAIPACNEDEGEAEGGRRPPPSDSVFIMWCSCREECTWWTGPKSN